MPLRVILYDSEARHTLLSVIEYLRVLNNGTLKNATGSVSNGPTREPKGSMIDLSALLVFSRGCAFRAP